MEKFADQLMKAFDDLLLDDRKNIIKQLQKMKKENDVVGLGDPEEGYNQAIDDAIAYIESLNKKG